jgi:hypothetical protein
MGKSGIMAMLLAGGAGWAARAGEAAPFSVTVYMDWQSSRSAVDGYRAKFYATKLFADAGINIQWAGRAPDQVTAGADVIRITVVDRPSPAFDVPTKRQTLAIARPYRSELQNITVFYDRVQAYTQAFQSHAAAVFGHILAHEIGHVLEGVARHSDDGLMRAQWRMSDLNTMLAHGLGFADEDVRLLRDRLGTFEAARQRDLKR